MPICILRVLAQRESFLFPYRTRPEFAGSPAVIAAIGEIDGAAEQRATQEGGLVNSLIVAPELTRQRAVEAVLSADRLGAPPSEAFSRRASSVARSLRRQAPNCGSEPMRRSGAAANRRSRSVPANP